MQELNRKEKILYHINKDLPGIEIGPSHSPIAPKAEGYNVEIIDRGDREELVAHYADHNVDLEKIEQVDHVWKGETYSELIGRPGQYNWIIASHVIEHTPDLVSFLQECEALLTQNGVLSLAIPDHRFCFDHFRPMSGIAKVLDAYLEKRTQHSVGNIMEHHLNAVKLNDQLAWGPENKGNFDLVHPINDLKPLYEKALEQAAGFDIHAWCFTPDSFRQIIADLNDLGLIELKESLFFGTVGHEFFVTLSKNGTGCQLERMALFPIE